MSSLQQIATSRWSVSLKLILLALLAARARALCNPSMNSIAARERRVNDTSVARTYVLCPFRSYSIGNLNFDKNTMSGQLMLPLRANMTVKCGDSGSRENACYVDGGVVQVDGTDIYNTGPEPLDNVVLQGITFTDPIKYAARFNRPGHVSFVDCEFRDMNRVQVPVLLDYFDDDSPSKELTVVFSGCLFENIMFAGWPSNPAIVVGNGLQNRIIIENSRFIDNDMVTDNDKRDTNSYLIESIGPITIRGSCFEHNQVGVSPVVTYHSEFFFVNNYQFFSMGGVCQLGSHFESEQQFDLFMPRCTRFDVAGLGSLCPLDQPPIEETARLVQNSTVPDANSTLQNSTALQNSTVNSSSSVP